MDTERGADEDAVNTLFTGPIETVIPSDDSRYGLKPEGTSDQGHRED